MGWGRGSEVMARIIPGLMEKVLDDEQRKEVYKVIIEAMEHNDWDTQDDCLGVDHAFNTALEELHPNWYWYEEEDEG